MTKCDPAETYPHAAQFATDNDVYVMYQTPNWAFNEIGDLLGADFMNWVFVGTAVVDDSNIEDSFVVHITEKERYQKMVQKTKELINQACIAQKRAKAQYSKYYVGAALMTENNTIILGCNIESKAYPTTICAERVAIFSALSQGHLKYKALALVTKDGAFPCGSCRQIIYEYLGNIPIYISNSKNPESYEEHYIKDLLPYPFG